MLLTSDSKVQSMKKVGFCKIISPFLPQYMHFWPFLGKYKPCRLFDALLVVGCVYLFYVIFLLPIHGGQACRVECMGLIVLVLFLHLRISL